MCGWWVEVYLYAPSPVRDGLLFADPSEKLIALFGSLEILANHYNGIATCKGYKG